MSATTTLLIILGLTIVIGLALAPTNVAIISQLKLKGHTGLLVVGAALDLVKLVLWVWFAYVTGYWLIAAIIGTGFLMTRMITVAAQAARPERGTRS